MSKKTEVPTYREIDLNYGTLRVMGDGPVRDCFGHGFSIPIDVFESVELMFKNIYRRTGEIPTITLFAEEELNDE